MCRRVSSFRRSNRRSVILRCSKRSAPYLLPRPDREFSVLLS
jgi:hypothetical protein